MPRTPTELHFAIINEEIDTAKQLINNGASINEKTLHGRTALDFALFCIKNDDDAEEIVKLLIRKGADVYFENNTGKTPLEVAYSRNKIKAGKVIIEQMLCDDLSQAKPEGLGSELSSFWDNRVSERNAVASSQLSAHQYSGSENNSATNSSNSDYMVSENNNFENDSHVKHRALSLFEMFLQPNAYELISNAILDGVNINQKDGFGMTILHQAIFKKKVDVVSLLINAGAKLDAKDYNGQTPLHAAVQYLDDNKAVGIVNLLISKGATLDLEDNKGNTPLALACMKEKEETGKAIISKVLSDDPNQSKPGCITHGSELSSFWDNRVPKRNTVASSPFFAYQCSDLGNNSTTNRPLSQNRSTPSVKKQSSGLFSFLRRIFSAVFRFIFCIKDIPDDDNVRISQPTPYCRSSVVNNGATAHDTTTAYAPLFESSTYTKEENHLASYLPDSGFRVGLR